MATPRVDLKDHMKQLWGEVGFKPESFELAEGSGEVLEEEIEKEARSFTPPPRAKPSQAAKERYTGIQVRNFPLKVDIEEVMLILEESGLPKGMKDNVKIFNKKRNSYVDVEPLPAETCTMLIEKLDFKEISIGDKRLLHCGGLTSVSPTKHSAPKPTAFKSAPQPPSSPKSLTAPPSVAPIKAPQAPKSLPHSEGPPPPLPLPPNAPSSSLPPKSALPGPPAKISLPPAPLSPVHPPAQQLSRLPGVKITEVPRPSKAERNQVEKLKQKKDKKIVKVSTPGSRFFHGDSSSDEESGEENKKENSLKKMFIKDSSSSSNIKVKEIKAALNGKHKLSPEHDAARNTKNRLSSSSFLGLGNN